jgi:arylesterase/paraoxonase
VKKWLKRLGWTALGLVAVLAIVTVDFLRHGGQFRELTMQALPDCKVLAMEASAEDIQIDRANGLAYLSYLDRRGLVEGKQVRGTVMLIDLNASEPRPRPALASDPADFRPHGMSLYRAGDGSQRLFVISHTPIGGGVRHEVHLFEQGPTGAFVLLRTVRDPLFRRPNAMVATGPEQFYVANDSGASGGWQRLQEFLLRRGLSTVAYFDGSKARVVASGIKSGAGIALSPDGTKIYVSETVGKRIRVFARNAASGDLTAEETVDIDSAPDNLSVDSAGRVWIVAHARTLALVRSFADAANKAPTQVLRFDPAGKGAGRLQQVYMNSGAELSGGAGAAVYQNSLLMGSITDRKLVRCRLP